MDVVRRYDVDGVHVRRLFLSLPGEGRAGTQAGFSRRRELAEIRLAQRPDPRRMASAERGSIRPERLSIHQGGETVGEIRHQPVRHLAPGQSADRSRAWMLTQNFTPIRACGWPTAGSIILRRNFIGRWTSGNRVFPSLLQLVVGAQNVKGRHLWPGLKAANVGSKWEPEEIARQIQIARRQPGVDGQILYHLRTLQENQTLAEVVRAQYLQPALVPASPWLESIPPDRPKLTLNESRAGWRCEWATAGGEPAWLWVLQFRSHEVWTTEILPANQTSRTFHDSQPDVIAVSVVDRVGNESEPAALKKTTLPSVRQSGNGTGLNWRSNLNR